MLWQSIYAGMIVAFTAFAAFAYYDYRSRKELGGITGDTAGYFVLICEGSIVFVSAMINILM